LLRNTRHKAVLCVLGSFISARDTGQFIVSFIPEWELSTGLEFKPNVVFKSMASKHIESAMNNILKNA